MQEEAIAAQSSIKLKLPDMRVTVHADPVRAEQVVTNLIHNAIKYGEGKPIVVRLLVNEHWIRIEVADHGSGISCEKLEGIFQRFGRLDEHRSKPGLGLGLWISDQIARAHKGKIEVKSSKEGSLFSFLLPCLRTKASDQ
jgi:signal transduction histidine kinase